MHMRRNGESGVTLRKRSGMQINWQQLCQKCSYAWPIDAQYTAPVTLLSDTGEAGHASMQTCQQIGIGFRQQDPALWPSPNCCQSVTFDVAWYEWKREPPLRLHCLDHRRHPVRCRPQANHLQFDALG